MTKMSAMSKHRIMLLVILVASTLLLGNVAPYEYIENFSDCQLCIFDDSG